MPEAGSGVLGSAGSATDKQPFRRAATANGHFDRKPGGDARRRLGARLAMAFSAYWAAAGFVPTAWTLCCPALVGAPQVDGKERSETPSTAVHGLRATHAAGR
jgi:hypothetical protein